MLIFVNFTAIVNYNTTLVKINKQKKMKIKYFLVALVIGTMSVSCSNETAEETETTQTESTEETSTEDVTESMEETTESTVDYAEEVIEEVVEEVAEETTEAAEEVVEEVKALKEKVKRKENVLLKSEQKIKTQHQEVKQRINKSEEGSEN